MAICVTEQMIDAAQTQLPGVWNRARVRRALEAAIAQVPIEDDIPIPTTLTVHCLVDEQQLRADVVAAVERTRAMLPIDARGTLDLAELKMQLGSPQPTMTVHEPVLNPALGLPLELGSQSDIANRLHVGRSTVSGWIKNREANGMPGPVDGLAYDLPAVEAWHRDWKAAG